MCVKFLFYFSIKTYFFYFTQSLLQNNHIKLSIIHPFLFKYLFIIIIFTFIFSHMFYHLSALFSSKFRPPQNFLSWTFIAKTQIATIKANLHGWASISFIYCCRCLLLLSLLIRCCQCFFFCYCYSRFFFFFDDSQIFVYEFDDMVL